MSDMQPDQQKKDAIPGPETAVGSPLGPNRDFRQAYWDYRAKVLEPTDAAVNKLLRRWKHPSTWTPYKKDLHGVTVHQPVARFATRIKRLESVEDKIRRHPNSPNFARGMVPESFKNMHDTLGARIVVHVLSDLSLIHELLQTEESIVLTEEAKAALPPHTAGDLGLSDVRVESPPSGYASIHYRVRLAEKASGATENPVFEIQVRTLVEDAWAEIEHLIGYKREAKSVEVGKSFFILSQQLGAIDSHFDLLNENMRRAQDLAYEGAQAEEAELGPDTLPGALLRLEPDLVCNQREVDGMLRALKSYGIVTVRDLNSRGKGHITDIRRFWKRISGRPAQTFDVISVLTCVRADISTEDAVREAVDRGGRWRRRRDSLDLEKLLRALRDSGYGEIADQVGTYETGDVQDVRRGWKEFGGSQPSAFEILMALYARARWAKDQTPQQVGEAFARFLDGTN